MINITNDIITNLKHNLPSNVTISAFYPSKVKSFPLVTIKEISNTVVLDYIDSSGCKISQLSFEINIFDNKSTKNTSINTLRNEIDNIMSNNFKMLRDSSEYIENYVDTTIDRYIMRYSCMVDSNYKIYRG